ncbi:MAG: MBL fold metallo-hydrolase, partial [Desulfohalobiaceae bacterium]
MIQEISAAIFRLTIPMPNNPLKYLNAYLLRNNKRHCLIDTGFNRGICRKALLQSLEELGVQIADTEVLITHMHSDHSGLAPELYAQGARIWMNGADAEVITQPADWSQVLDFARKSGLPEQDLLRARDAHPGYKYRPQGEVQTAEIKDGDIISCAGYELRCLLTPGHSKGHVCFYSEQEGLLFAGDTLLQEITPDISLWLPGTNPLGDYLQSLQRLHGLE